MVTTTIRLRFECGSTSNDSGIETNRCRIAVVTTVLLGVLRRTMISSVANDTKMYNGLRTDTI